MSGECPWHPEAGELMEPGDIRKAFGPTAGKTIPLYPDYSRVKRYPGSGPADDAVFLSRLSCGHFLVSSPTLIEAAEVKSEEKTGLEFARMAYRLLLQRAHDGEDVDPADLARAQAAITVQEKAAEGRRERQEAAKTKAEQERREALEGPAREQLAESQTNLQSACDDAFTALFALLDAVDDDAAAHDAVRAALTGAGVPLEQVVPPVRGYVQSTRVGDDDFVYFSKAEWLISLLQAIQYSRHRNSFVSVNGGRELRVPAPIAQGPRVSEEAREAAVS